MKRTIVALTAMAVLAASCGDTVTSDPTSDPTSTASLPTATSTPTSTTIGPLESVRYDATRATSTDVTDVELAALVAGNSEFARKLFAVVAAGGGNVMISPYSVAAALTMTYAGARGDTAAEIAATLHLPLADDRIHAARNELDLLISTPPRAIEGDDREAFAIAVANSLWGQKDYPFLDEFLELLAVNYDAGMNLVDFVNATEAARATINSWVESATSGRIEDLIPEGVLTPLTRLVIVNAIWFKANWEHQFDPANTVDGEFTLLDGSTVTVPLMHQTARLGYLDGDGYAAVRLPYAGDALMQVIMPDAGSFDDVAARFAAGDLADLSLADHEVGLTMPKWEFTSDVGLKRVLQSLGIEAAFIEPSMPSGADFTGITEVRELFVHDVLHKAFIAVDETGTEAAAATAVIIGLESLPQPATMTIDRPFIFTIEHRTTGEILFVGQVVDPS